MEAAGTRLDTLQAIELAEGVEVRLRIAGPLTRGGALLLDMAFQAGLLTIGAVILLFSGLIVGGQVGMGIYSLILFLVTWWYPVFFEASRWGATPGKRITGLRVVQVSGSPITFSQALLRNFLRCADGMPYLGVFFMGIPTGAFGLAAMLASRRFQRLGDLAAGTVVIYDKVPVEPSIPAPPALEKQAPSCALRPDEVKALAAFRARAGLWSDGRRQEIADHARELSGSKGPAGVSRLMAMAHWLQEKR